ncbi:AMP-binding protein [Streptomyces sp. MBT56]|nr:AMP-binding protein [Streptomyces sp. MBT56]MBK3600355.1 AMP-binding protein [Streptomyces sp. MBT54]MBK3618955.1 AMP-binding protein [Streptomyces sp. MBT98]MBK6041229.1 AMP-binding protein [Streptomyces sp. MBT55]
MPHTVPSPDPEAAASAELARRAARVETSLAEPGAPFAVVLGERGTPEYADGPRTLREFVETTWAYGEAPFLIAGERACSYGEFFAAASALAVRLREGYGLRPGDRAVIASGNRPEWQIAFWAAQLAGLVAVPLDAGWTEDAVTYALEDCEPGVLLVDGERLGRVAGWARRTGTRVVLLHGSGDEGASGQRADSTGGGRAADGLRVERYEDFPAPDPLAAPPDVEPRPEDDATILYTPGATGRLRGAVATHLAQAGAALNARYHAAASARARGAIPGLEPAWVSPMTVPFSDAAAFTGFYGAMAAGGTLALTDDADAGGGPAGYGLAETCGVVLAPFGDDRRAGLGGAGRPAPVTEVRIAGPAGEELPDGEPGELWLRGQSLFRGYWRDAAATGAAFADGGWFRTGDRAVRRDGWVSVVGRLKGA